MRTKILLIFITFSLLFSSCEKDAEFKSTDLGEACKIEYNTTTPLIAGQNYDVGTVKVEYIGGNIIVTYETIAGWFITETHLHIAKDLSDFPTNKPGNPRIGNFMFGDDHEFKEVVGNNKVIYTIPWTNGCYYIAAHAVVNGGEGEGEVVDLDAFNSQFLPDGITINIDLGSGPAPGNSSYYKNTIISGGSFLDGTYNSWCIEGTVLSQFIAEPTAYSTYGSLPPGIVSFPLNFDKVNWLLNNVYAGMVDVEDNYTYTWGDIQMALYGLLDDNDPMYLQYLYLEGYDPVAPQNEQPWWNKVAKLIQMAETNGKDFVPGCGELIAIALDFGDKQNILITYPLPCYPVGQEETAWGRGCPFTDGGSWAMYFKVCDE